MYRRGGGLTGLLALIIVVADATIADYGECTITINEDKDLVVDGGASLLATLKEREVFIPSACGGRGSCGLCKCAILDGAGDVLPTELPWLNPDELAEHLRLSCQVKVKGDMSLRIPAELLEVKQYRARVGAIRTLTPDMKEIELDLVDSGPIRYKAGQFIQFEVPPYDLTDEPVYRAYSVACCQSGCSCIELEVTLVPDRICSTYIHKYLSVGDEVTINGPYGEFYLRPTEREILFIATGSGMAPIRAMLQELKLDDSERRIRFFFGARHPSDLFHVDEMEAYERDLKAFSFHPVLSRPAPEDGWTGEVGRVTSLCEKLVDQGADLEAYLCGNPAMIDSTVAILRKKGIGEDRIFYDKFS